MSSRWPAYSLTLFLPLLLAGCGNGAKSPSPIEVVKIDTAVVAEIVSHYDSTFTEIRPHSDWRYIEHYVTGASSENVIARDSQKKIVAIMRRRNGRNYFVEEYYPSGQSRGKVTLNSDGDLEGPVKYYYEDGRVSCTGRYGRALSPVGEWRRYDSHGRLTSIEHYSSAGRLESADTTMRN
jgi:hypothetical protein